MQNDDLPESSNVEDRRGEAGAGGFGMPFRAGGMSIGTIVVLGLVGWALGIDPSILIGGAEILTNDQPRSESPTLPRRTGVPKDDTGSFVSRVLGSTEVAWRDILAKDGRPTMHRSSSSTTAALMRAAVVPRRARWARSIARLTNGFISTPRS
jgi:predicted metalloprotease